MAYYNNVSSGAAPGNAFPRLDFGGGGYTSREWQQLQDQRALQDYERTKNLMRIGQQMRQQTQGNIDGSPNVVFQDNPNSEMLGRKDREEIRLRDRALDLTSRGQDVQRDIATDRNAYMLEKLGNELAIKQQRADAYDRRVDQPNLKVFRGADGKEYTWDENTGKIVSELGASARMTDDEIARRRQSDMLERIAKQLEGNIQRDDNRAQNERTLIGDRVQGQIDVNAAKPVAPSTPREQMQELDLRFRTALNDPKYAPFIQTGADGRTLSLVDASRLTPEQLKTYQEVRKYLFPPTTAPASSAPTAPTTTAPAGKILVINPQGKQGYVNADRAAAYSSPDAVKQGWKVVEGGK